MSKSIINACFYVIIMFIIIPSMCYSKDNQGKAVKSINTQQSVSGLAKELVELCKVDNFLDANDKPTGMDHRIQYSVGILTRYAGYKSEKPFIKTINLSNIDEAKILIQKDGIKLFTLYQRKAIENVSAGPYGYLLESRFPEDTFIFCKDSNRAAEIIKALIISNRGKGWTRPKADNWVDTIDKE